MAVLDGQQAFVPMNAQNAPIELRSDIASVPMNAQDAPFETRTHAVVMTYPEGFRDGERAGFAAQRQVAPRSIAPGETDSDKKTIEIRIYTATGLPASGITGEGAVFTPVAGDVQVNRDLAGYVNIAGTFTHVGDGVYRYTFSNGEVAGSVEGNTWLRTKKSGFRTVTLRVPLRVAPPTASDYRDIILNAARSGHVTTGTVGEGVAIGVALLQGNIYMDQVVHASQGQTSARIRCFHTGAAAQAATAGASGEGEFATFVVTTAYADVNKVTTHRVVQQ